MTPQCRYCNAQLAHTLVDLGSTPLANSYLPVGRPELIAAEPRFPLRVMVCTSCWLAQTTETLRADTIFNYGYAYHSSHSAGWVAQAKTYADAMEDRFGLDVRSTVVEIGSNDGYLLQHFKSKGVPTLGVEPAGQAAEIARSKGIPTRSCFFDLATAKAMKNEGISPSLMIANNVLAHVPDIREFAKAFQYLLSPLGVATFEFPHLANLLAGAQFDTIYHEHYSYLSLGFVERLMTEAGLDVFDAERLPSHGGSLRVFAGHPGARGHQSRLESIRSQEADMQMTSVRGYDDLGKRVERIVRDFWDFARRAKADGKKIAGYGAAAKGNTFLNVAGVDATVLEFVADLNPEKQNTLLPGSHIPVLGTEAIADRRPDYLLILPWNIAPEVKQQQEQIRGWGGKFVCAIPELAVE
jgi:C-methyltransferase C-terminal domain/Putative zinc binding domain/Methyltransferase domain